MTAILSSVKAFQDLTSAVDAAGMCLFTTFALGAPAIAAQLSGAVQCGGQGHKVVLEVVWRGQAWADVGRLVSCYSR